MENNYEALSQMGITLAHFFDCMYYINSETGKYYEYVHMESMDRLEIPGSGDDFFSDFQKNAPKWIHPGDLEFVTNTNHKDIIMENLTLDRTFSMIYKMLVDGTIWHVRLIYIMCEDNKHIICGLKNISEEIRTKKEQERNLQSAKRQARLDKLTGIHNKNAFIEFSASMDEEIKNNEKNESFAIVMCDVNDLKLMNDTRGHSFGDEAIQRACRMVCSIYEKSPVFRVGGDEFVVVLKGWDYEERELLLKKLKEESDANQRSRSGPSVACGMAVYNPKKDKCINDVYKRADEQMYLMKNRQKSAHLINKFTDMKKIEANITDERKHRLDGMFGALYTIAGEGYVFINDMRYDFSRWSLSLIDDFGLESEYMYHADQVWQDYIHPDDLEIYRRAVDTAICGNAQITPIYYRARLAKGTYIMLSTRAFILSDSEGNPEYFGGIIIPQ